MKEPVVVPQATRRRSSCYSRPVGDPYVECLEDLGLFFCLRAFKGDRTASENDTEITLAIERMVRDGTEPPAWILQELLRSNDVVRGFVESCSAVELCVLLYTLKQLKDRPQPSAPVKLAPLNTVAQSPPLAVQEDQSTVDTVDQAIAATSDVIVTTAISKSSCTVHYEQLHDALADAVRVASETDGRDELLLAFHGDGKTLRTEVVTLLAAERHIEQVAILLGDVCQSAALPVLCIEGLQQMAATGHCVSREVVEELSSASSQAILIKHFKQMPSAKVDLLMLELSRAATASLSPDVLTLWTALQSAASASGACSIGGYVATVTSEVSDMDEVVVKISTGDGDDGETKVADEPELVVPLPPKQDDFYANASRLTQNMTRALDVKRRETKKVVDFRDAGNLKTMDEAFDAAAQGERSFDKSPKSWSKWFKSKMPSLAKLEIMRDFAQTISLVFTSLYTAALAAAPDKLSTLQRRLEDIQIFYRGLSNAVAADVTAVLLRYYDGDSDFVSDVFFGILIAVILVACICFVGLVVLACVGVDKYIQSQVDQHTTYDEDQVKKLRRSNKRSIRRVTIVLTICQSVHLPVARLGMEILTSSRETNAVRRRYENEWYWTYLYNGAIILLPMYVGGLILLMIFLIQSNAPKVTQKPSSSADHAPWSWSPRGMWQRLRRGRKNLEITNLTGERVEFHNSVYAELIKRDPKQVRCPYRSLYRDFEHHWRFYKVWQLTIKVVLTMLLIWFQDAKWRAILTVIVTFLSFLSTTSTPFIDDFDDRMELSSKFTSFITCLGGVTLAYHPQNTSGFATFVSLVVSAINILNTVLMAAITMFGTDSVLVQIRNLRGQLTFSNSQWYAVNMPAEKVLPRWDVKFEIRHRVWHAFWKKLLLSLKQDAAIQRLANASDASDQLAVSKKRNTTAGQLEAQKLIQQQQHWQGQANECVAAMRLILRSVLEGPDVYYEPPRDVQAQDNRAGFGELKVVPYPFKCVFKFDEPDEGSDTERLEVVDDADVAHLFFTNFRSDVIRKRELRQQLRALSAWGNEGGVIELPFEREEQWIQPQQDDGNSATETEPNTAPFLCRYTRGVISLGTIGADGAVDFNLRINYRDGTGDVLCPNSGKLLHRVANHGHVVEGREAYELLGISKSFEDSDKWRQILQQPSVAQALAKYLPQIHQAMRDSRQQRIVEQDHLDRVLSGGFRFVVYNNPHISRHTLEKYLREEEQNEVLRHVPTTHRAALDLLYERLHFIYWDPRAAFWYLFWHDVYEQNGHEIEQIQGYRDQFDPELPTAICYVPKSREDLQSWLQRRNLWGEKFVPGTRLRWRKNLFHKELLDLLYECMDQQVTAQA